ncbi:MAG: DUF1365 domain-containing protein [Planctomycetales bacterium]|nr:DUF1365 domain-containing protein [Planctomycetales bacterium]
MHSCLYTGRVRHRRFAPQASEFSYPLTLLYLDLDELPRVASALPLLSQRRHSIAGICREHHLNGTTTDWRESLQMVVREETGNTFSGPVRMLTLWSSFGRYFNPLTLYFCFEQAHHPTKNQTSEVLKAIVAEVTNTPWRERHLYVLSELNCLRGIETSGQLSTSQLEFQHRKQFHVSPFLDTALDYHWLISGIGQQRLTVHLEAGASDDPAQATEELQGNGRQVDATLTLERRELTTRAWLFQVARYPFIPLRVLSGIYYEAFRLWLRRTPFYPHPQHLAAKPTAT